MSLLALTTGAAIWEGSIYREASALRTQLEERRLDGDQAWEAYSRIRDRSPLGFAAVALREPLRQLLESDCDRVVDEYRTSDAPRVKKSDWERCRRLMGRVRQIDPGDRKAAAMVEYADGHLLRIGEKNADAVAAFQRAAALHPSWPDPHLGLARAYVYGLKDFNRGTEALKRAKELGHPPGRREQALWADAYRTRATQFQNAAAKLRDTEQEKELLSKAKEDLEEAIDLYSELVPWGDTAISVRVTRDALAKVQARLDAIDPPRPFWPWKWPR